MNSPLSHVQELSKYVQRTHQALFSTPAPAPPIDCTGGPKREHKPKDSSDSGASKERTAKDERFKQRGRVWLGCAAGAVLAYVLLSGSYIEIDPEFFNEDDEE